MIEKGKFITDLWVTDIVATVAKAGYLFNEDSTPITAEQCWKEFRERHAKSIHKDEGSL